MSTCELCWATFENDEELAKHVEMEEAVDWPIDGLTPDDGDQDSTYAEIM